MAAWSPRSANQLCPIGGPIDVVAVDPSWSGHHLASSQLLRKVEGGAEGDDHSLLVQEVCGILRSFFFVSGWVGMTQLTRDSTRYRWQVVLSLYTLQDLKVA